LLYDETIYLNEGLGNIFKQPSEEEFKSGWEKGTALPDFSDDKVTYDKRTAKEKS
jgi:hypothetical protein